MGYIDADAHVRENDRTWTYFDPSEREYAPVKTPAGVWQVGDRTTMGPYRSEDMPEAYLALFPFGTADLEDPGARIRRMDELGVDVQVMFSTWWLGADVASPLQEAALARSWNRWMSERTADSGGRLAWALEAPVRMPERAIQEMEFGKEHGAVAVHYNGVQHGLILADSIYLPIYEKAQELGLAICVHVGGSGDIGKFFLTGICTVPGALFYVLTSEMPTRFPKVRWGFLESSASWLPFVFQEAFRAVGKAGTHRVYTDWKSHTNEILAANNLYVACQLDDDIAYLLNLVGTTNLVQGTDYGHWDVGSDPYGLQTVANRTDIDSTTLRGIVDRNARVLYGIDPDFNPAPEVIGEAPVLNNAPEEWVVARV